MAGTRLSAPIHRYCRRLVERRPCEEDGRGHIVVITEAGRDLRRRIWPVYAGAIIDAVGAQLSQADAVTLADLLRRLPAEDGD